MIVAVIPARYQSHRLEAKLLLDLAGKTVLQRTYEQVLKAQHIDDVVIATDDDRIIQHALDFGATAHLTSTKHQSGTDRIAELAKKNNSWNLIVNVQADEPFINPDDIDRAVEPFIHDPLLEMSSLYHTITEADEINNPNNVKVVTDINDMALYFSRAAIPYDRDGASAYGNGAPTYKKHIGLYVYRRDTLLTLCSLEQTDLEQIEKLEQLRALANGIGIKMLEVSSAPIGIDTSADYDKALEFLSHNS